MADKILEGILAAQEGATVYRKADGHEMMVTGVACSYIDKYGNRQEAIMRFIELASEAKTAPKKVNPTSSIGGTDE